MGLKVHSPAVFIVKSFTKPIHHEDSFVDSKVKQLEAMAHWAQR